ncbi:unnamed protein product [Bemisia tabaci]|uniref:Helicase ATP-binding domain-containing protein n=1 Tax=Bemisia tabaci TaxID=7038 RepID=A0A9P0F360_BEMTA|nr:unnamed protein product [Bemisia tabaci]
MDPPSDFPFPFPPYEQQHRFMRELFLAIENKKLGIFESPTGTGKSLSMICGTLCWLLKHEEREKKELEEAISKLEAAIKKSDAEAGDDWLSAQGVTMKLKQEKIEARMKLEGLIKNEDRIKAIRSKKERSEKKKVYNKSKTAGPKSAENENEGPEKPTNYDDDEDILLEDDILLKTNVDIDDEDEDKENEDLYSGVKVIFCSRTHSQLSQFVSEVQRSPFSDDIRLVPLASRQNYCINDAVRKLSNLSLINERCNELLQKKSKSVATKQTANGEKVKRKKCASAGCLYNNSNNIVELSDDIITEVQDVEQLVAAGRSLSACPYFASRGAVPNSQIIVVPYNTLLHKPTRDACGVKLKDNVVLIDEAHNLLDAIAQTHSTSITGMQIAYAYSQLSQYRDKYESRFSATNLLYLNQLIYIVGKLISMLGGKPGCDPIESSRGGIDTKLYEVPNFVFQAQIDNLNIYQLLEFCTKSRLTQKLQGYSERYQPSVVIHKPTPPATGGIKSFLQQIVDDKKKIKKKVEPEPVEEKPKDQPTCNNPILPILAFITSLTSHTEDGRVVCSRQATVGKGSLKFLLLNPASQFVQVVKEARCVILAGGTMEPISEFKEQLFMAAGGDPARIVHHSFDHVIPQENILPVIFNAGPTGKQLDFSHQFRSTQSMLSELGRILINVCNVVPAGVVCFFPSYDYENLVFTHFEKTGVIEKISLKKKVFREPKKPGQVETVLSQYAAVIHQAGTGSKLSGALLFSVIGGKLSEGLNFSDDLGRCVIVVGLPYPNSQSPELQEKMKYLNEHIGEGTGQRHYEALCMRAVNQSIGRAVRHSKDYAAVLLLDHRYSRRNTTLALPSWIQASLQTQEKFGPGFAQIAKFFSAKKNS